MKVNNTPLRGPMFSDLEAANRRLSELENDLKEAHLRIVQLEARIFNLQAFANAYIELDAENARLKQALKEGHHVLRDH